MLKLLMTSTYRTVLAVLNKIIVIDTRIFFDVYLISFHSFTLICPVKNINSVIALLL